MRTLRRQNRPVCRNRLGLGWVYRLLAMTAGLGSILAGPPSHPLDALSTRELWTVYEVLRASGRLEDESKFVKVQLRESPKSEVLKWKPAQPFSRRAGAIIKTGANTFEAVVDIQKKTLASWVEAKGVQVPWLESEFGALDEKVKENPQWQAAMRKRGTTDFNTLVCLPVSWHYTGSSEGDPPRIVRVNTFNRLGVSNFWARHIGGVTTLYDLNEERVVEVVDQGVVPMPTEPADYDLEAAGKPRDTPAPILVSQPQGPGFRLDGNVVSWQKWKFHLRVDPRQGTILSDVRYADGEQLRPILYQASLSEIFVPYLDPSLDFNARGYLDLAENSGSLATSLEPGLDCPDYAVFFDAVVSDVHGIPKKVPKAAALFEVYDGTMAWRHKQFFTGITEKPQEPQVGVAHDHDPG